MKKSRRLAVMSKRLLSSTLITTMLLSGFTATNIYYNCSFFIPFARSPDIRFKSFSTIKN
jgi:hypothetical protein